MKNKMLLIYTILLSVLAINIVSANNDILTYDTNYTYNKNIQDIVSLKNDLYIVDKTSQEITKTDTLFTPKITKKFPELINQTIIEYNDNILLVGIEKNALKIYLLDSNIQTIKQVETSYLVSTKAEIKTYYYEEKIYLVLFENDNLYNSNIYEIDKDLNIIQNTLSSYDSETLKKVLKGDYYIIRLNDTITNNRITHYTNSSYYNGYSFLVGNISNTLYNELTGYEEKSILTIIDNDDITNIENNEYVTFKDIEIVNEHIVVLASNPTKESILIYSLDGVLVDSLDINNNISLLTYKDLFKVNNQLVLYAEQNAKELEIINQLTTYTFTLNIKFSETPYGTMTVPSTSLANSEVPIEIIPNSGFEIDSIKITDSLGNEIKTTDNKFTMPENDILINVSYRASVTNPETNDLIILVSILTIFGLFALVTFIKKLKWLR